MLNHIFNVAAAFQHGPLLAPTVSMNDPKLLPNQKDPPIDGRPPIGTEAWWFSVARRDLQGARRAFESAEQIKRCGGYGWRKRRASWFAGALEWLSMAIDARNHGRELRAKRLVVGS